MMRILSLLFAVLISIGTAVPPAFSMACIKDIASLQGVRENQLVGYGLGIGLNGSGDSMRVNVCNTRLRTRSVAAVAVTVELPAFIGKGGMSASLRWAMRRR